MTTYNHRLGRALALAFSVVLLGGVVSACNTMEGAGQDIQAGGEALEESAEDVQD